jgi:ABC-type transporter Mla MlaB component
VQARPAPGEPNTIVVRISGRITRSGIPSLCERVRDVLEATPRKTVLCDVRNVTEPDAAAVDALSRLRLTALRLGRDLQIAHASGELRELTEMMGLSGTLRLCAGSGVEPGSEPE